MLRSKFFAALALLLCASTFAQAAAPKVIVSYTKPTLHVDGTPITGALTFNLYQGAQGTTPVKVQTGITYAAAAVTLNIPVGTNQCFGVTAVEAGLESDLSSPLACIVITNTVPASVSAVTVTITFQ